MSTRGIMRNLEGGRHLDSVLMFAVSTVLVIRFSLALAGYPKLGGETLHIAHVLWGGLLMLVSLVLLLSCLGRRVHELAAILGGIGFGTFIDEVGKFITHDSNYFYRPAVSIIYVVFVLLYLGSRSLSRARRVSQQEYLANALQEVAEIAGNDLSLRERDRALRYLDLAGLGAPLAVDLKEILRAATLVPEREPGVLARWTDRLIRSYHDVSTTIWFGRALILFFVVQLFLKLIRLVALANILPESRAWVFKVPLFSSLPVDPGQYTLVQWLQLGSGLLSGVFVALGVVFVFSNRLRSLLMFQRSIFISLLITQVFVFYRVEWLGIVELAFNLLVLLALRFAVELEQRGGADATNGCSGSSG
jgi:hypothetical protein